MTREDFEKLSGEEQYKLFTETAAALREEEARSQRMMSLLHDEDAVFKPFVVGRLTASERRQRQILLVALIASWFVIFLVLMEGARIMGWLP